MSSLEDGRPSPSLYVENGHDTALRRGTAFNFHAEIEALGAAAISEVRFKTGDLATIFEAAEFHINQELVTFEVYENVTFTVAGNIQPKTDFSNNMNRMSTRDTQLDFYTGVTVDTVGTRILHQAIVGEAGKNVSKPGFGSGGEAVTRLLKPNTEHVFRITNGSVLAANIEAHVNYREVTASQYKD